MVIHATADAIPIDDLGHEGARSTLVHFTVDQTPPAAPTVVTPQDGSTTTTSTPQVTAHSEPGARVHLLIDGFIDQGVRTADASGNVTFSVSQALSLGQHGLMVFAVDVAGNIGATTLTTFTVSDSTQPTEPTNPVQPTDPAKPTTLATPSQVKLSSRVLTKRKPVNVAFTLSTPGTVQLQLTRTVHGKARTVTTATIKVGHAGKVTYTLRTGVGKHKLTAGAYNLTLVTVSG